MNEAAASNFINSLVRNLQVLCHSNVEFRNDIEVVGHLYLKVDKAKKFNYIVDEKVCKNDASSTMFVSNSYHSVNTAQKKKDEQQGENTSKSTSETGENTNNEQARLTPSKPDNQPGMSPMSSGTPDIYKTPTKRGLRSPDGGLGRKHPRLSSDGTSHQSFSFSLQRDRESPLKKDRSGSFSASQDSSSSHSFKDNFKNDSVEIDLTNIKEEVDDKSAIQASCFFNQEQQQQMLEQSSVHSFSNQSKDSSTGEETLGLYPIALHQNENQNLDSLAHLSSSVAGGSQGASFGQSPQQMPQFLSVSKPVTHLTLQEKVEMIDMYENHPCKGTKRLLDIKKTLQTRGYKELTLREKVKMINEYDTNPSTLHLATKYGIARPTVYRILKRKDEYIKSYQLKYDVHEKDFNF